MDLQTYCRALPKMEMHAHLNGSLSRSTMLELKRYYADSGIIDSTNAFCFTYEFGAGDTRNLAECFSAFGIAHSLTTTTEALRIATSLTLKEFADDGCCYIELRSTPRDTPYMSKEQYIETIVQSMIKCSQDIQSGLIVSINRNFSVKDADALIDLVIEFNKKYPDIVVGVELSGDPTVGRFEDFLPVFTKARKAGLKVALHCGEVYNPDEILKMIEFKPDRLGHGTCIHPKFGGTEETWTALCKSNIPVEICLTSNVRTKCTQDYDSHHFKEFYEANVPVIICTDDKGVFSTSLSQEYLICAQTFNLTIAQLAQIAIKASQYVFSEGSRKTLSDKLLKFIAANNVNRVKNCRFLPLEGVTFSTPSLRQIPY